MESRPLPCPPSWPNVCMIYITFIVHKALYVRASGHPRNHPVMQHLTGLPPHRLGTPGPEMAPNDPGLLTPRPAPAEHQAHRESLRSGMAGRLGMSLS